MEEANLQLRKMFDALGRARDTVPPTFGAYAGTCMPPVWPREQMTVMFRMLATDMGLPERCCKRCRRAEHCMGGLGEHDKSCLKNWDEPGLEKLDTAILALLLSWCYEKERHKRILDSYVEGKEKMEAMW